MGVYANKFIVEVSDVVRVVFSDERAPIKQGLPMSVSPSADVVMTIENARQLRDLMNRLIKDDAV